MLAFLASPFAWCFGRVSAQVVVRAVLVIVFPST